MSERSGGVSDEAKRRYQKSPGAWTVSSHLIHWRHLVFFLKKKTNTNAKHLKTHKLPFLIIYQNK